ncbi:DNA-3-methyladenine glycosylase family protein [Methylocella silvestris]|uniref:DNA-3-methyladenine glycosylase II n=1 Tax=Methylocella silvestris TaxID=199596 RepID=A0A2J7THG7_METSI|nr:DNA-3-methyladenine glycosylase [Methylocella silvestris]PNG26212.1 Fe-S cluster assembly protein HesB [Methylocella silvestris]
MARLVAEGARSALRKREPGFHGLAWIIMGQQLSVASAAAIWRRLIDRFGTLTPSVIEAAKDEELKACGLSAPEICMLRAIAEAITSGALPLDELGAVPADAAHAALTAVKGLGPGTVDIYLVFCPGHSDAFAVGDLALQEAARLAYAMVARPSASELVALAERWRPWRAVAAKALWAHYKIAKGQAGVSESAKPAEAIVLKKKGRETLEKGDAATIGRRKD